METSMTPAEMANSANYAAMNYGELLNTKTAYSWAIGFQIEPRLKTRRREEMVKITQAYVTAMNGYDATREEILSCLENVGMKETHMFSSHHDVDDQTSSVREYARQDNGKSPLALPEPVSTMGNQDKDAEQGTLDSDTPEKDEAAEDDSAASSPEGDSHLVVSENKDDVETPQESGDTIPMTPGEHNLVDEALDVLKTLPAPDDIDVNTPYYVEAIFAYGDSSKPGYSDPKWRNMGMKDLEAFRSASEKYEKLFLKHDVLASTDDYLAVNESMNSVRVRMYHFPEEYHEGDKVTRYCNNLKKLSEDELKYRNKWSRLMRTAIKKAKKLSYSNGIDANTPFYDKYKFRRDGNALDLCEDRVRIYEDAETLSELMPSFETYAKLYRDRPLMVSKDNCVADATAGTICLVLFNIPSQEKKRVAPHHQDTAKNDSDSVITAAEIEVMPPSLLVAAVEYAKGSQIPDDIDVNAPYYVESEISYDNLFGKFCRNHVLGRNLGTKDLETFRSASEKHVTLFLKKEVIMSTDDCLVFKNKKNSIIVRQYHFPELGNDGQKTKKEESTSNSIPYDVTVHIHKTHRRMKKAIEMAKEYTASVGLSSSPFYDKYEFRDNAHVELNSNPIRVFEDTMTLSEVMSSFETVARLSSIRAVVISEDNSIAVKLGDKIYVLISNFPGQEKKDTLPQKKKRGTKKKSEPAAKENSVPEENPLITKAVEMTRSLPVNKTTDKNAPYFIQCDYSVTGNGDLFPGRTFSRNVDSLEKYRTIHQKCATTFMATQVSFTDDYTAYMWSGEKTISVFYYNAKNKAEAVA